MIRIFTLAQGMLAWKSIETGIRGAGDTNKSRFILERAYVGSHAFGSQWRDSRRLQREQTEMPATAS
jgi:hypothetical protein